VQVFLQLFLKKNHFFFGQLFKTLKEGYFWGNTPFFNDILRKKGHFRRKAGL
jgi:hypothetical protein